MNRFEKAKEDLSFPEKISTLNWLFKHFNAVEDALTACASGVYKIKPMVWYKNERGWFFNSDLLSVAIVEINGYFIFSGSFDADSFIYKEFFKTLEEAKSAAQKHYEGLLLQALERVE